MARCISILTTRPTIRWPWSTRRRCARVLRPTPSARGSARSTQAPGSASRPLSRRVADSLAGLARRQQQLGGRVRRARSFGELAAEFLGARLSGIQAEHVTRDPAEAFAARELTTRVAGHAFEHLQP